MLSARRWAERRSVALEQNEANWELKESEDMKLSS